MHKVSLLKTKEGEHVTCC